MGIATDFTRPRVGIVGGTGRMGSWFADVLERVGSEVFRVGRKTDLTPAEIAAMCDVVVISVPIRDTVKMIQEIGPLVSEDGLLMDLTSIKKKPMETMIEYSRAEVVGAHPLFGPDTASGPEQRVAVCPGRGERGLGWLLGVLRSVGSRVTILSPERHDHLMGLVQGVNHFSTLALALCIRQSGLAFEELLECSTQTFRHRLDRIRAITEQQSELFESLLMDNPPAAEFIDQYLKAAGELAMIIRTKDSAAFGGVLEMLKEIFKS